MKATFLHRAQKGPSHPDFGDPDLPQWYEVGESIEGPECWRLVCVGLCKAADDECSQTVMQKVTQRELTSARRTYEARSKGIRPEDYRAFELGQMIGYDETGHWVPGPNYEDDDDEE